MQFYANVKLRKKKHMAL